MRVIRRHLTYANVVATLALVFAMSGGALAARHYLVTSTKQISPKVLRALARSSQGPAGATGPQGAEGPAGPPGAQGATGATGITKIVARTKAFVVSGGIETEVPCNPGERAISGGVSYTDGSAGGGSKVTQSAPAKAGNSVSADGETPTAWRLGFDGTGVAQSVTLYAVCVSP
jgi:hypothetical protein